VLNSSPGGSLQWVDKQMDNSSDPCRYAQATVWQARAVLAAAVALAVVSVAVTLSPAQINRINLPRKNRPTDPDLYEAEIEGIRAGRAYYAMAAEKLVEFGYPTHSVFNWRTPLPMWLLAQLPDPAWGRIILCALGFIVIWMSFEALGREHREGTISAGILAAILLLGPILPMRLRNYYTLPGHWAGVLIAISVLAYGLRLRPIGVLTGLAAAFFRDLALPYCLLCAAIAWWQKRRWELWSWVAGLVAWGLFFTYHCWQVANYMPTNGYQQPAGWLQFLGLPFVIATCQMSAYLLLLPQWVTALYFVAAVVVFLGWRTELGVRSALTVAMYMAAFWVVGHDYNQYWGVLTAPLICLAVAQSPRTFSLLLRAAKLPGLSARAREPAPAVSANR